ncbi:MAG: WHG domain-containing protein [Ktedonobacteraceae bacterium]|nr:WHG domain-containing protein [Ktedonobacteraceae bacterium]
MRHRAGLDHETVIQAAANLLDEQGLEQLSLTRLAERLGIRTPSLYNYVNNLADLKRELARYSSRELLRHLTRATIGKAGNEAVFALADAYRAYARTHPACYALTQQVADLEDRELREIDEETVNVARAVLAPYRLSEVNMLHAIRGLRSFIHGFVSLEISGGFGLPLSPDESFHWSLNVLIAGLEQAQHSL